MAALAGSLLGACAAVAGCSSAGSSGDSASGLREGTGTDWVLDYHPVFKTVSFALPKGHGVELPRAGDPANAVLALLDRYKDAFGMKNPTSEWALVSNAPGERGYSHLRFRQTTRGVSVFGSDWIAAIDGSGQLTSMSGVYVPGVDSVDIQATSTAEAASAAVRADVRKRLQSSDAAVETKVAPQPVIYSAAGIAPTLALSVFSDAGSDASHYLVDAHTGAILARSSTRKSDYAKGYGASHYLGGTGEKVSFPVTRLPPEYWFLDGTTQGAKVRIRTSTQGAPIAGSNPKTNTSPTPPDDFVDQSTPKGAAVDAQAHIAAVVDAYKELFGRSSFDDKGGDIQIHINENGKDGKDPSNAFWQSSGCSGFMGIGDGDKDTYPLGASVDVMAHELTHGITACTWGGGSEGNSDAINEAMSDILGAFIDGKVNGGTPTQHGRNARPSGAVTRNLGNPHDSSAWEVANFGNHCATVDDACPNEEHLRSTIVSYAWYLMTMGGEHITTHRMVSCPIGWEASRKLWYDVETKDLSKGPDYKAVANATMAAGKRANLRLDPIACAWVAVNVITADDAKKDWNVTCAGADAGASSAPATGSDGGIRISPTDPTQLVCPTSTSLTP